MNPNEALMAVMIVVMSVAIILLIARISLLISYLEQSNQDQSYMQELIKQLDTKNSCYESHWYETKPREKQK